MPNSLTREGLQAIGQALFGLHWQTELALRLNISPRTVRRYLAGTLGIPAWMPDDLRQLAHTRGAEIKAAIAKHLPLTPSAHIAP